MYLLLSSSEIQLVWFHSSNQPVKLSILSLTALANGQYLRCLNASDIVVRLDGLKLLVLDHKMVTYRLNSV